MKVLKRAPFRDVGYIIDEQTITRPTVTVLRDENSFANKEKDLIVCGVCGSLNNYKKNYCGGCGAKFKKVSLKEFKKYEEMIRKEEESDLQKNQLSIEDYLESVEK